MNDRIREYDDLSDIKGIGTAKQLWLRESLDVGTFRSLAVLSPARATEQLSSDGHKISTAELEKWIAAAQQKLQDKPERAKSDWRPFAAFVVEFQARNVTDEIVKQRTTAHYMEGDKEQKWPGLEGVELCRWILSN